MIGECNLEKKENYDRQYLDMMNQWMILRYEGKCISDYLAAQGIGSIVIYGMNVYARHMIRELLNTNIKVICVLDINPGGDYEGVKIISPFECSSLGNCDLIINAVLSQKEVVKSTVKDLFSVNVIDMDDLVFDAYYVV